MSSSSNSSSSSSRRRRYVRGIPASCDCTASIVTRVSKTDANPGRRYYRCSDAATQMNAEEFHCFKWVDEAVEQEVIDLLRWKSKAQSDIDRLGARISAIEKKTDGARGKVQMKSLAYIVGVCVIVSAIMKYF